MTDDSVRPGLPVHCTMVSVIVLRGPQDVPQMLVARRAGRYLRGEWSYIAGHVEAGENGSEAALRELREETGLVPKTLYATSFCEQFYAPAIGAVEIVPAFVAQVDNEAQVHLNGEHSTSRWVSLEEATALLPFGSQHELLGHVWREFVQRQPSTFLRVV